MDNEKIFIIGDIHGCLEMFEELMNTIEWSPESDRLIFLGDYIDRGMNPKGVIDYLIDLRERSDLVQCILGNHEKIFLDYLDGRDLNTFFYNGGETTLDSYEKDGETHIPEEHIAFLRSLDSIIELDDFYIVHAGLRPGIEINRQDPEDMLWIRDPFIFSDYNFGKRVIFGHTPFTSPLVMKNKIGLDTGAVFGNKLTCLELTSMEFYSVEAEEVAGICPTTSFKPL